MIVARRAVLAVANLRRSATGLRWLAVRSNERAAAAAGINVSATKLGAFAVSSFLAGLGGALLAYELPALSPQQFLVVGALAVLALCYLGGIATMSGALIAGVLASGGLLTQLQGGATGNASSYQFAVSGLRPDRRRHPVSRRHQRWPSGAGSPTRRRSRRARRDEPAATAVAGAASP